MVRCRQPHFTRRELLAAGAALGLAGCARCGRSPAPRPGETLIEAAQRHAGTTLRVGWESGIQAAQLAGETAPRFREQTGIRVEVVELGTPTQQFRRIQEEHRAGAGDLDLVGVAPAWLPELVEAGALQPLDPWVDRFPREAALDDYLPLYRKLGVWAGHRYGLFDDGDVLLVYYRRDLFADPALQAAYRRAHGEPLLAPDRLDLAGFERVARFFGEALGPTVYGLAPFNPALEWGWFQAQYRAAGGRFFDPESMRAEVGGPAGAATLAGLARLRETMPPGNVPDRVEPVLATFLAGNAAMASFWPPLARMAEGQGGATQANLPASRVAGRTGYALLPGGVTELAVGFLLSVLEGSRNREAAALFALWMVEPATSLSRVMAPAGLRDPYRRSHVEAPAYRALWPTAGVYLDTLAAAASGHAYLDLAVSGANDFEEAFHVAMTDIRLGTAPDAAAQGLARRWNDIVARYGARPVRREYREWLRCPGAAAPGGDG